VIKVEGECVTLNGNGYLRGSGVAVENTIVIHHHLECSCWQRQQIEELGHSRLDEVVCAASVNQNHDTVVVDGAIYAKILWCQHPC